MDNEQEQVIAEEVQEVLPEVAVDTSSEQEEVIEAEEEA
jgi:hypothetical protein